MPRELHNNIDKALSQIPGGLFVLTTAFEGRRGGVLVKWVQPCSYQPPMVMVALATGQSVEPLIRDSRWFTLSQISAEDRFLLRKFNGYAAHTSPHHPTLAVPPTREAADDPLLSLMTITAPSGCAVVERALAYFDCEVIRHIELEGDHRIYVGHVHRGGVLNPGTPAVRYGNGCVNGGNGSNGGDDATNSMGK